jgi:hypothetical protein
MGQASTSQGVTSQRSLNTLPSFTAPNTKNRQRHTNGQEGLLLSRQIGSSVALKPKACAWSESPMLA